MFGQREKVDLLEYVIGILKGKTGIEWKFRSLKAVYF